MDKNIRTLSLARKHKQKRNDGICFFYSDGKIGQISEWKERREGALHNDRVIVNRGRWRNGCSEGHFFALRFLQQKYHWF